MGLTELWPFKRSEQARFEALVRPRLSGLYRLAYRLTGQRDDAEDLVQELLLKLYPRLAEMEQVDRLQPWLKRVLYRLFIDQHRRQQRSPIDRIGDENMFYQTHAGTSADPADVANRELTHRVLLGAMAELKPDHRLLLILHDMEGHNLQDISAIVAVPVGTIKSRLSRARARLREILRHREPNSLRSVYRR